MTSGLTSADPRTAFARRDSPIGALAADAPALAAACHAMALRFRRGGRLLAIGTGPAAADAAHVVVEFVHPVIIGKRALPALAVAAPELGLFAEPDDVALAFAQDRGGAAAVAPALAAAQERGLLTVALTGGFGGVAAEHVLAVPSEDRRIVREAHVTAYHVLWELVHVFLETDPQNETIDTEVPS